MFKSCEFLVVLVKITDLNPDLTNLDVKALRSAFRYVLQIRTALKLKVKSSGFETLQWSDFVVSFGGSLLWKV